MSAWEPGTACADSVRSQIFVKCDSQDYNLKWLTNGGRDLKCCKVIVFNELVNKYNNVPAVAVKKLTTED